MATATTERTMSGPPFPLEKLTTAPWREQALTKIGEQRFLLYWMSQAEGSLSISDEIRSTIHDHWNAAQAAAKGSSRRGASVERVRSHLDAVDADLLRLAPVSYVLGQVPGLLEQVRRFLPKEDMRRTHLERLAALRDPTDLTPWERDLVVAACHAAAAEARREVTRLRSFRNVLLVTAGVLGIASTAVGMFAFAWPDKIPMCFSPDESIVCTTSTTAIAGAQAATGAGQPSTVSPARIDDVMRSVASGWDIAVVLGVGLLAAALAAATSLRRIRGTSTPFALPVALALLKLPTGALTAVLGLVLMRGQFVPGLSALDSPSQIVSWAVVLGYSQQLLTRFVDQRAQTVLDNFGRTVSERQEAEKAIDPAPAIV